MERYSFVTKLVDEIFSTLSTFDTITKDNSAIFLLDEWFDDRLDFLL